MDGFTLWFTGLSGAGKTTLSKQVAQILADRGHKIELFDGDIVREHLSKGLGFSKDDRDENVKRIGFVCKLLSRNGVIAIAAAISPYAAIRAYNRKQIGNYVEVFCDCSIEALIARDVKGLYKRALAGEIKNFTGISDPYEKPTDAEIVVHSDRESEAESLARIIGYLEANGHIPKQG